MMQTIEHFSSYEPVELLSHPTRDDGRVDLDGQVTLHYVDLGSSVVERTQNVSSTGMFVRTSSLRPAGTILRFELDLGNGLEPLEGRAEVVWVRREGDGLFRPAGMGVRFIGLDAENQKMIRWSVEHRMRELRKPLHLDSKSMPPGKLRDSSRSDLDDLRVDLEEALGDEKLEVSGLAELRAEVDIALQQGLNGSSDSSVPGPDEDATAESVSVQHSEDQAGVGRRLWRFASAVPLIPAVALCLYFLSPTPEPASATPQVVEAPQVVETVVPGPASPASAPSEATPMAQDPAEKQGSVEDDLEELIMTWADSWSQQRARSYLALYSPDFQPPNALDRETWETIREERILKPRQIQVEVRDIETEVLSAERARVSLTQIYSSDRYQDTVRKSFDLIHGDQGWKILAERVVG